MVGQRSSRGRAVAIAMVIAASAAVWTVARSDSTSPTPGSRSAPTTTAVASDALVARARAGLAVFTSWLARNHAVGIISEVGWPAGPDAEKWNALADAWYRDADAAKLWVTAWASGPFAPFDTHQIYAHTVSWPVGGVDRPTPQSSVVERHPSTPSYLRGVAVTGGSWGDGINDPNTFSNEQPGQYGVTYFYENEATFRYLASRGVKLVRIDFKWERLQPVPGGPLDPNELARLRATVDASAAAGLSVILDLHNYGAYQTLDGRQPIGSPGVPISAFTDLWSRISREFSSNPSVVGYGLMNEPHDVGGPRQWERISQAAVDAIRATGDRHEIDVSGDNWSAVETWATEHPTAWIHDPLGKIRYDAHQYFDGDHTERYLFSYDTELAAALAP